tara:strand:- start:345 stop:1517 length:1173 start_codon:yes stop_codon:yes gene_type:complete
MINFHPEITRIEKTIINIRRDIHKHPELSFKEYRTADLIAKKLDSLNIKVTKGVGKTGVIGDLIGSDGPCIALRADMDALPIQETGNLEYKSINDGVMHACGHDGHIAMLLGAAEVLSKMKNKLNGSVRFIFQPAEEGRGGARYMIKDGCLNNVDEIYGAHLWNYQEYGTIGVQSGPIMAAADMFKITINGKGGHGAAPQGCVDSIIVASHLIQSLQTIVSRNTNPLDSTVVSIGKIKGGHNFNIIADQVILEGTTRSYTEKNRLLIKSRMKDIIIGTEKLFNAQINFDYEDGYPPTINNSKCTTNLLNTAKKIVNKGAGKPYLSMGGEDFSYYGQKIPSCFFFVGSLPKHKKEMSVPHHCSHFDIDEKALLIGSSVFVSLIESLLMKGK